MAVRAIMGVYGAPTTTGSNGGTCPQQWSMAADQPKASNGGIVQPLFANGGGPPDHTEWRRTGPQQALMAEVFGHWTLWRNSPTNRALWRPNSPVGPPRGSPMDPNGGLPADISRKGAHWVTPRRIAERGVKLRRYPGRDIDFSAELRARVYYSRPRNTGNSFLRRRAFPGVRLP